MSEQGPLVVGLKYCGGCRAEYDRGDLVQQIQRQLNGKIRFVRHDCPDARIVLAVHGCRTACADLSSVGARVVWSVTSQEDAVAFVQHAIELVS